MNDSSEEAISQDELQLEIDQLLRAGFMPLIQVVKAEAEFEKLLAVLEPGLVQLITTHHIPKAVEQTASQDELPHKIRGMLVAGRMSNDMGSISSYECLVCRNKLDNREFNGCIKSPAVADIINFITAHYTPKTEQTVSKSKSRTRRPVHDRHKENTMDKDKAATCQYCLADSRYTPLGPDKDKRCPVCGAAYTGPRRDTEYQTLLEAGLVADDE